LLLHLLFLLLQLLIDLTRYELELLLELRPEIRNETVNLVLYGLANVSVLQVVEEIANGLNVEELTARLVHQVNHIVQLLSELREKNSQVSQVD
jgi:hypothetical protein